MFRLRVHLRVWPANGHADALDAAAHGRGRALRSSSAATCSARPHHRYPEAAGTLENAQAIAAHESLRTTKLYDHTGDEITLDEVERITI
jgi:hypothetical protein